MTCTKLILLMALSSLGLTIAQDDFLYGTFPEGFLWGAASSAYQIEGAWNTNGKNCLKPMKIFILGSTGKGENHWDFLTHAHDGGIVDNSTGDVAADSYHKYLDDVACLKETGVMISI